MFYMWFFNNLTISDGKWSQETLSVFMDLKTPVNLKNAIEAMEY